MTRLIDMDDEDLQEMLVENDEKMEKEDAEKLDRDELVTAVLDSMTIEELKALPEVQENDYVKRNRRDDVIAAARGEAVEREREENARAAAERENEMAPDQEPEDEAPDEAEPEPEPDE